ncbi:hypothetical protein BH11PSE3_BH11PSE3_32330 [soil metagenome]
MSAASDLYDFDEAMAELENMLGEMQRNPGSSPHRQVVERYLEEFKAPPGVGRAIESAMAKAAPFAEELRLLLVTAEKENWTDTDKAAQMDAGIARLRRVLMPVAKAVQASRAEE